MKDYFSVLIENKTEFEKGNPARINLSLPATKEELHKVMKTLNITAENPQDFFINGYSTTIDRQIDFPLDLIRKSGIDELNYLAARLEEMSPAELNKLNSVMCSTYRMDSLEKLIDYTFNTDYFTCISGVYTRSDLGRYHLNDSGMVQMPEEWKAGIDKEDFGSNISTFENGKFTDYGYIKTSGEKWKIHYTGNEIPEQYRVMSYPEPEMIEREATLAFTPQESDVSFPAKPLEFSTDKPADRMKEITDRLEKGIQAIFESDRFKSYLNVMAKFHNYSMNNTLLIAMQKPDATLVAGFNHWKDTFHRHVLKGEKGIKVLAPSPYTVKREMEKINPNTGKPVIDKDGKPVMEEKEITVPAFKVVSVFDVSQTDGKELPSIGVGELTGNVDRYQDFFKAIEQTSPVLVNFEKIEGGTRGYYHIKEKRIAIKEGMSELQNLKTMIHEIAHAKLHDIDLKAPKEEQKKRPDKRTREIQAESIAYAVCQHYKLDTSDYSFGYVAGWSSGRELAELKASLEIIRSTASALIRDIDKNFAELSQTNEQSKESPKEQIKETVPEKEPQEKKPVKEKETDNTFSIYQLKRGDETINYRFEPYERLQKMGLSIDPANYEHIYTAPLENGMGLEDIFNKFNLDHPQDFKGHSLSVSDVVILHQNGKDTAHYVDSFGYKGVPEFLNPVPTCDTKPQEKDPQEATDKYYSINEEAARRAKEANSFSDYKPGSATAEYRSYVDEAVKIAERQKAAVDPMHHEKINRLLDAYARKLAENMNNGFAIESRVPSILIAGGGNFPVRKKEKQNAARDKNMEEWRDIRGLLEKIRSTGMGGISADDPNAIAKLENKLAGLENSQKTMKAVNAYFRKHKTLDGCTLMSPENIEKLKTSMSRSYYKDPKPFEAWALSNNSTEIRRTKARIEELTHREETPLTGWEFDGGKVAVNKEDNRLQVFFDEKPDEEKRIELKKGGFRWSPSAGAWQRQLNGNAFYATNDIKCIQPITGERPTDLQRAHIRAEKAKEQAEQDSPHDTEQQAATTAPDNFLTGEMVQTPRGNFHLTSMTQQEMKAAGYGVHHQSDDGKYFIMGDGTRAFAICSEAVREVAAPPENPLEAAEKSTEQNYNMIDGQINNTPSVNELEAKVKAGEVISLMELAAAVKKDNVATRTGEAKKEQKPSIRKQLEQDKESKKTAPKKQATKNKNKEREV